MTHDAKGEPKARRAGRAAQPADNRPGVELRRLASLALPVVGAQLGAMMLGTVDTLMVAGVSVEVLAAAAMANAWIFACLLTGQGLVHGIDPLVTQAHGAGRGELVALAFQRGVVLALLVSVPLSLAWLFTEPFLLATGQAPDLARQAHVYTLVQIPSIPFYLVFLALRQYLQGRELMRPTLWVVLLANVFNVAANWILIYGKLGAPALGLLGAGIATTSTRVAMLVLLVVWVRGFGLTRGAWKPWSREVLDFRALRGVAAVGFPVALQMSLEVWAFSAATLVAGRLGAVALAAHTIVLNMASISFMMALGVSQGAVTRVGNLIGARRPDDAQRAAWVAVGMGAGVMTLSAAAFLLLRRELPSLYTGDAATVAVAASILPIAGAFQIFDGVQVVSCGVLRGMGRTRPAAWFNLLAYWVLALPLAGWLVLRRGWGLEGVWWSLCLGLGVVAALLVMFLRARGPAHASSARFSAG